MLPFVMGMQCQNVVSMLLMTLRYVVKCEMLQLSMHPSTLGNWKLLWKHNLHPKLYYSKKFGVQRCHKSLLFKAYHLFAK